MKPLRPEVIEAIKNVTSDAVEISNSTPPGYSIKAENLIAICKHLHENPDCFFDMLTCISGVDNGRESGTMEVVYHLYSIPFDQSLVLKIVLNRDTPELESLCGIWKSANWMEREVYDMFGIVFKNHPDLRRILMPNDWIGFPLRKDYKEEERYHGVQIKY